MIRHKKSAWLLDTAEADLDYQSSDRSLLPAREPVNEPPAAPEPPKDFATLRAEFALRGRVLTRSHRVPDGTVSYIITSSWGGARYFTHLHDVQGHLNQVMESRL